MYSFGVHLALYPQGAPRKPWRPTWSAPEKEPVMRRSATSRAALLLVLVLVAAPALQAAPPSAPAAPVGWNLVTAVWDLLKSVWSTGGCEVDPNGGCQPRPARVEVDNGCEVDPSGRCRG